MKYLIILIICTLIGCNSSSNEPRKEVESRKYMITYSDGNTEIIYLNPPLKFNLHNGCVYARGYNMTNRIEPTTCDVRRYELLKTNYKYDRYDTTN